MSQLIAEFSLRRRIQSQFHLMNNTTFLNNLARKAYPTLSVKKNPLTLNLQECVSGCVLRISSFARS